MLVLVKTWVLLSAPVSEKEWVLQSAPVWEKALVIRSALLLEIRSVLELGLQLVDQVSVHQLVIESALAWVIVLALE